MFYSMRKLTGDPLLIMREVCDHISATTSVLRYLRKEIEMALAPPLIIIVGDQAPLFSNKMSREAFIADKVPAVVLVPRQ